MLIVEMRPSLFMATQLLQSDYFSTSNHGMLYICISARFRLACLYVQFSSAYGTLPYEHCLLH